MTTIGKKLADAAAVNDTKNVNEAFAKVKETVMQRLASLTVALQKGKAASFPHITYVNVDARTVRQPQLMLLVKMLDEWLVSEDVKCHINYHRYEGDTTDYWQLSFSVNVE